MNMTEFMRIVEGLKYLGLSDEETLLFLKYVESGNTEFMKKIKEDKN